MQYSSNHSENFYWQSYRTQWRAYRQLEMLSDSVPEPNTHAFTFGLGFLWRGLLNLLAEELVEEQQVEYLDRCWALNEVEAVQPSPTTTLKQLWTLME